MQCEDRRSSLIVQIYLISKIDHKHHKQDRRTKERQNSTRTICTNYHCVQRHTDDFVGVSVASMRMHVTNARQAIICSFR